eukprot:4083261-Pleurochrysis_carterae.AAC.1
MSEREQTKWPRVRCLVGQPRKGSSERARRASAREEQGAHARAPFVSLSLKQPSARADRQPWASRVRSGRAECGVLCTCPISAGVVLICSKRSRSHSLRTWKRHATT